jgi:hypothetical protein
MGCNCGGQIKSVRPYKRTNTNTPVPTNTLVQQSQQFLLFIDQFPSQLLQVTGDVTGHVYEFNEQQRLRGVFVSDIPNLMPTGQFVRIVQVGGLIGEFEGKFYRIHPQDLALL